MDLRTFPDGLSTHERIAERRRRIEEELQIDISGANLGAQDTGQADERNCEQMFGAIPLPVGYAGPLQVRFSSAERLPVHLPLATTEGVLVASVNRGCKAVSGSGGVQTSSIHHGTTRSLGLRVGGDVRAFLNEIEARAAEWKATAEGTSRHLKILGFDLDDRGDCVFLTIHADTDEAMGMNMVTIAAQAVGEWIQANIPGTTFVTVAANVDSDKKPSKRAHGSGRGFEVLAEAFLTPEVISSVLKTSPEAMVEVARAKLELGSRIAGALSKNLHAANVIAALYLATGQDAAHVVEGSLTDTDVHRSERGLRIRIRCPALLVGVRGGGVSLPAQAQCLQLLLRNRTALHPKAQLAESIGAAVLAGEISLLAALAGHQLAKAHQHRAR